MNARPVALRPPVEVDFRPRFPWLGGDLQTLRNFLILSTRGPIGDLSPWPAERLLLSMQDGSGDRLAASLHRPAQQRRAPVLLIHGLTGGEDSSYIRSSAAHLLKAGHPVIRLNLRGTGPSRPTCRLQYHAGRSQDLVDAIAALPQELVADGLFAVGYSLGGNVLLKLLGEGRHGLPIRAAASVSAPIDLARSAQRIVHWRNHLYHRWLLGRMIAEAVPGTIDAAEREAVLTARDIIDFDDRFVAARNGFAGAADYYRQCSAIAHLDRIDVPCLVIHALDDPWIPGAIYREVDWAANPALTPLLPTTGGHVGFHAAGDPVAWHDRRIGRFFAER
jgi:predicted alpha/beta-fold hydrolase